MSESRSERFENQAAVVGRTLAHTPHAILDEVINDISQRPGQVVQNSAMAAAIGYGATILMRRAPVVGTIVAGGALLFEGARVAPKVSNFLDQAGEADTFDKRSILSRQGALAMGREGSLFIQTLPAAGLGSGVALAHLERSSVARSTSFAFAERVEFPLRRAMPEELLFKGPGTQLKTNLMTSAETVDALGASRLLPSRAKYGVEYGTVIDPVAGKMSWKLPGVPDAVEMGVVPKPGQISVHLQNPHVKNPGVPSVPDLRAVPERSIGVINAGENSTFFMGRGNAKINPGADVNVQAVVLDHKTKNAFLHDYVAKADTETYGLSGLKRPERLNYDDAVAALRSVDIKNPWNTLSQIPRFDPNAASRVAASLDLNSGATSFLSRLKAGTGDAVPTFMRSVVIASNPLFHTDSSR
ncbi:MAG: hypothetical protein IAF58_17555 [Leptolyngbya sp.]|nr:hypothetical protein [Candidatus Melainabacteria bacterium]